MNGNLANHAMQMMAEGQVDIDLFFYDLKHHQISKNSIEYLRFMMQLLEKGRGKGFSRPLNVTPELRADKKVKQYQAVAKI